jgi:hypothetical protein
MLYLTSFEILTTITNFTMTETPLCGPHRQRVLHPLALWIDHRNWDAAVWKDMIDALDKLARRL